MYTITTPVYPRQIRLELTNRCNANCLTCHRHQMTRPLGNMSDELIYKCVSEIKAFSNPLSEIVLSNYGETFLFPHWFQVMDFVQTELPQTRIVLPTNGTFLKGVVERLSMIKTLFLVNVSVNAFLPSTYEYFNKLPSKHIPEIQEGIIKLRQLRPDIIIWVSMAHDYSYQSPGEVDMFRQFWSQYADVQINTVSYAGVKDKEPSIPVVIPCRSIFSDMVVAYNGDVSSCCFDADIKINLGSAVNNTLLDIWHGHEFSKLRLIHNNMRRPEIELCRSCTFS